MTFEKGKWVWMDGEFIPWDDAKVHISTHTFNYGSGVFEGIRSFNGKLFKVHEHNQRLINSAKMIGLEIPYDIHTLDQAVEECYKMNGFERAYVRPIAWFGDEIIGVSTIGISPHVAIYVNGFGHYFKADGEKKGAHLMWTNWVRPAPNMSFVHAKAVGQYLVGTLCKTTALKEGYDAVLMLDYRGYVAECSGANIFMVKNGVLYTPIADTFLNGITRLTVIDLAREYNIEVHEKHIKKEEIIDADEIFITGTAYGVKPIEKLGEKMYEVGPLTLKIQKLYNELVGG